MRSMQRLYEHLDYSKLNQIVMVYQKNKPNRIEGVFSGKSWRHQSVGMTLNFLRNERVYQALQKQAFENMQNWKKNGREDGLSVEVKAEDWGVSTLEATQKTGAIYTVLNMASSIFPGGAVLSGGWGQEENLWHRTTCLSSLLEEEVVFDPEVNSFVYTAEKRELLNARLPMDEAEAKKLSTLRDGGGVQAYKVFLSAGPQICFRGPEIYEVEFETNKVVGVSDLSYPALAKEDIFPFYELRAAAPELTKKIDGSEDPEWMKRYSEDLRRRIAAQLDTLILQGRKHVILGAWGCGSFNNSSELVSTLYKEEIEKRAHCFQHIIFPVMSTAGLTKYEIFQEKLQGIKLGEKAVATDAYRSKNSTSRKTSGFFSSVLENSGAEKIEVKEAVEESTPKTSLCNIL